MAYKKQWVMVPDTSLGLVQVIVDVESLLDARYHQRTWLQSWDPLLARLGTEAL
jgi:hypothetical protein